MHADSTSFRLDGKTAVITGGGGGIGTAAALALAQAGTDIAVVGRNTEKLEQTAARVKALGRQAVIVQADVTDEAQIAAGVDHIMSTFGRIDILFNNAGTTSPKLMSDISVKEWHQVLDVSLTGAFLFSRAVLPFMVAQNYGRILNMGSILSGRGMANRTAYCAAKAGLANFGAAMAFEYGRNGVTVNTIGATVIVTDLNRDLIKTQPQLYEKVVARSAIGRLGELDDVTGLIVFLASHEASFITGQTIYVDGGYTAG
jgi:2-deoxy-D-gluconate 3-dehydrogenase